MSRFVATPRFFWRFLLLAMTLGPALSTQAIAESTLDKIKRTGTFLAGVRFDYPPIGTVDAMGGPIGFGADLAKIIADKLGAKVKFVQVTSANRIPLLLGGQIDADIGPTTPYKKREETCDFSIPYIWDATTILVRKGDSEEAKDYAPPKKVASTQGSATTDELKKVVPNADMVLFQEFTDAVVALKNKKVDAIAINKANAVQFAKANADLVVGHDIAIDPWAIMVREDDSKWRKFLNWTIQELWAEGKYQAMYEKWWGAPPTFHMWSEYELQPGVADDIKK